MTLQVHPIALGCMLVVAVGTLIYTYVTSRQQAQQHSYEHGHTSNYDYDIPPPLSSNSSSRTSVADGSGSSSRKRKNTENCSICLGTLKSAVKKLNCEHVFHTHCINMWLNHNKTCPNCRSQINL